MIDRSINTATAGLVLGLAVWAVADSPEPVATLHVRGFDANAVGTFTCHYTDPAGLAVTLVGVRT